MTKRTRVITGIFMALLVFGALFLFSVFRGPNEQSLTRCLQKNESVFAALVDLFRGEAEDSLQELSIYDENSISCQRQVGPNYITLRQKDELLATWQKIRSFAFTSVEAYYAENGALALLVRIAGPTVGTDSEGYPYRIDHMLIWLDPNYPASEFVSSGNPVEHFARERAEGDDRPIWGETWYYWSQKGYYG